MASLYFYVGWLLLFLDAPTLMLANFIASPIELSLVVPFLRFGEVISGGSHFPLSSDALKKVLTGQASHGVLLSIADALHAPFIFGGIVHSIFTVFQDLGPQVQRHSFKPKESSPFTLGIDEA